MGNSIELIITLVIINIAFLLIEYKNIKTKKNVGNVVKMPTWTFVMALISSSLFLVAIYNNINDTIFLVMLIFFELLGVFIIMGYFNCKIFYNENTFIYKNFIGKKYEYTYDQIISCVYKNNTIHINTNNKKITISLAIADGATEFYKFVQDKIKK